MRIIELKSISMLSKDVSISIINILLYMLLYPFMYD